MLEPGIHGISNSHLDVQWPKAKRGVEGLRKVLDRDGADADTLLDLMHNRAVAAEAELPESELPRDRERALSSMFIETADYGTRCSTAVIYSSRGDLEFAERTHDASDPETVTNRFHFSFPAAD